MSDKTSQILQDALALPVLERAVLVDGLLSSLDRPDTGSMSYGRGKQKTAWPRTAAGRWTQLPPRKSLPNWSSREGVDSRKQITCEARSLAGADSGVGVFY